MVDTRNETTVDLEDEVRRLTAENERLRATSGPRRGTWRAAAVVLLLALATLLAPAAVVAGWARVQLTNPPSITVLERLGFERVAGTDKGCLPYVLRDAA